MKLQPLCLCVFVLAFASVDTSEARATAPQTQAVYDDDHRVDLFDIRDPEVLHLADSTVAMFSTLNLKTTPTGYSFSHEPMSKTMGICPDEKFADQPTPADCSGVLVGPARILTAGHCVTKHSCATTAFAFGYAMTKPGAVPNELGKSDVYFCQSVIERSNTDTLDYAVIDLDRAVVGHQAVSIAETAADVGDSVFLLSYPAGTPLKFSPPVEVTASTQNHFTAPIDALGGSSGGAMFSSTTHELVGILVSGATDYLDDPSRGCRRIHRCVGLSSNDCEGEDSTHVGAVPAPNVKSARKMHER